MFDLLSAFWLHLGLAMMVGPLAFFLVLERIMPAEQGHGVKDVWVNLKLGLAYRFGTFVYVGLTAAFTAWLMHYVPNGLVDLRFVTHGYFALDLLAALLWFLVYDFFYYWFHRAQHEWKWLWSQHRVHHSTPTLNVAAASAHHWLEDALRVPAITVPFGVLFTLNPFAAGVVLILANAWGYFIHANLRLSLGRMSAVFCGPQVHRVHHSREAHHFDKNYAAFFPVWDVVFGTYYHPAKNEFPPTGVPDYPMPVRTWNIFMDPFLAWGKGLRQRWARDAIGVGRQRPADGPAISTDPFRNNA